MSITKIEDYKNRFAISQNKFTTVKLAEYIYFYEKKYLIDLFGKELYDLFILDLDTNGNPQSQRFIDIFEEIYLDPNTGFNYPRQSLGIKEMLKGFIYFEYTRKQGQQNTIIGNQTATAENSERVPFYASLMIESYNEAVLSYETIRSVLIEEKTTIYPEYNGTKKEFITPFS